MAFAIENKKLSATKDTIDAKRSQMNSPNFVPFVSFVVNDHFA
jgi:hypothetical protein